MTLFCCDWCGCFLLLATNFEGTCDDCFSITPQQHPDSFTAGLLVRQGKLSYKKFRIIYAIEHNSVLNNKSINANNDLHNLTKKYSLNQVFILKS